MYCIESRPKPKLSLQDVYDKVKYMLDSNLTIADQEILANCHKDLRALRHECTNYDRVKSDIKAYIAEHVIGKHQQLKVYNFVKNRVSDKIILLLQEDRLKKETRIKELEELLQLSLG